jgi:glycine cleavage system H protein
VVVPGIAAIGLTDKMQKLMDVIKNIKLPPEGDALVRGDYCGYTESYKMNVDLPAPLSGTVMEVNRLMSIALGSPDHAIHVSPYVRGWMMTIKMSKPTELLLMTADEYLNVSAKDASAVTAIENPSHE